MQPAKRRHGSTALEFVFATSFILLPLLFGMATVGMSLLRALHVVQLDRDTCRLFASGVDLSQAEARNLVLRLANGLDITDSGGSGVVILSEIKCIGAGQAVCTRRIKLGNAALQASRFTNPNPANIGAGGAVNYAIDPGAVANTFLNVLPMSTNDVAYLSETYLATPEYDWAGLFTGTGIYTRSIF